MKLFTCIVVCSILFVSCKKNAEKILGEWQLTDYVEFDSLGDRKYGFNYSEVCPFKILKVEPNVWSNYDIDCNGGITNELNGYYHVDEDTLILEGFDTNNDLYFQHFVFNKLNKRKLEMDLIKTKSGSGEWEWVDRRYFGYRKL